MLRVISIHQNVHGSNPEPKKKQDSIEVTLLTPGVTGMTSTKAGREAEGLRGQKFPWETCVASTQNTQMSEPKVMFSDTPRCYLVLPAKFHRSLCLFLWT